MSNRNLIYKNKLVFIAPNLKIKELMDKEINSPRTQELIKLGGMPGVLEDDVCTLNVADYLTIIPNRITHRILSFKWDGMELKGEIELSESESKELFELSMESKDIGYFMARVLIERNNRDILDIQLITFDFYPLRWDIKITDSYFKDICEKLFTTSTNDAKIPHPISLLNRIDKKYTNWISLEKSYEDLCKINGDPLKGTRHTSKYKILSSLFNSLNYFQVEGLREVIDVFPHDVMDNDWYIEEIEAALDTKLFEAQRMDILNLGNKYGISGRQGGKTFVYYIRLALSEGDPLNMLVTENFADLKMFFKIWSKLKTHGFITRDLNPKYLNVRELDFDLL